MAQTAATATVEIASGTTIPLTFHKDGTDYTAEAHLAPSEINGLTTHRNVGFTDSADNAQAPKTSPATLYRANIFWKHATPTGFFLKIYDKASAPTVSDTPKLTIMVEPVTASEYFHLPLDFGEFGLAFANGIGYRISALVADSDATYTAPINAVASGALILHLHYK